MGQVRKELANMDLINIHVQIKIYILKCFTKKMYVSFVLE